MSALLDSLESEGRRLGTGAKRNNMSSLLSGKEKSGREGWLTLREPGVEKGDEKISVQTPGGL